MKIVVLNGCLPIRHPQKLAQPGAPGKCWSIDFMADKLTGGVRFRTFNIIDDFNREPLGIDIGVGMPSSRVTRYLDRLAEQTGYPKKIRCDNGPEFTSGHFKQWAEKKGIYLDYIEPGCPYQNGYIERFNRYNR